MVESQKVLARRKYMREYMRRRAVLQKRKFPQKPRMNPAFYIGDIDQNIKFRHGSYRIDFD